jgi:hypothetical protein
MEILNQPNLVFASDSARGSTVLRESYILDNSHKDRICLTGLNITLNQQQLSPERDLIVRAENVEIT